MNRHFQSFRYEPTPGVIRYLQAPETFEGVVQRVDVTERRTRMGTHIFVVNFILEPLDVFGASSAPLEMLVHDEVVYESVEAMHAHEAQRELERERRQPVSIPYIFPLHDAAMWAMRATQVTAIYRKAFGDEFADELAARLQGSHPDGSVNPFSEEKDADGGYVAPAMRQIQELRGLRFVVNAIEMATKSKDRMYTHHEWTRS